MTRVLFLHGASNRLIAAARWLAGAAAENRSVLVYAPSPETADQLDRLLWTQTATGFIPHCREESPLAAESPIVIAEQLDTLPHDQALLNLSQEIPPGFSRFEDVIEVVSSDEADRLPARERFRFYRERGYAPQSIDLAEGR
jgi:DNA polymerase-3 subunit chi